MTNQPTQDMADIFEDHHDPDKQQEKRLKRKRKKQVEDTKEDLGID